MKPTVFETVRLGALFGLLWAYHATRYSVDGAKSGSIPAELRRVACYAESMHAVILFGGALVVWQISIVIENLKALSDSKAPPK